MYNVVVLGCRPKKQAHSEKAKAKKKNLSRQHEALLPPHHTKDVQTNSDGFNAAPAPAAAPQPPRYAGHQMPLQVGRRAWSQASHSLSNLPMQQGLTQSTCVQKTPPLPLPHSLDVTKAMPAHTASYCLQPQRHAYNEHHPASHRCRCQPLPFQCTLATAAGGAGNSPFESSSAGKKPQTFLRATTAQAGCAQTQQLAVSSSAAKLPHCSMCKLPHCGCCC